MTHVLLILALGVLFGLLSATAAGFPVNGWRFWVFAYCVSLLMSMGLALLFPVDREED